MTASEPAAEAPRTEASTSRRDLAVARSLDPARARAEKRVQRFLDAGLALMESDSGKDFTLQQVVEKSGQSLRSFYQYFAGKHELLLALFEESVRSTAEHLAKKVDGVEDPLDRLHRFAVEYYAICRPPKGGAARKVPSPAMAEFAQQLLTEHPREASQAFVPLVELVTELLDEAAAAGVVRADRSNQRVAGIVLQAIMFNAFATTISGSPVRPDDEDAEELWDLVLRGLAAGTTT